MQITSLDKEYLPAAAELFLCNLTQQRQAVPSLPDNLEDPTYIEALLAKQLVATPTAAALIDGQLVGYLGAFLVEDFRGTQGLGAYTPEWAHAAAPGKQRHIYPALYRFASTHWSASGCQIHAITLLANDQAAREAWFWNGFGLTGVDAMRSITPLEVSIPGGITLRKAVLEDVPRLADLEQEHWQHYKQAPIFMAGIYPSSATEIELLLGDRVNNFWLAQAGEQDAGYMRFEGSGFGAAAVVQSDTTVAITGAYVKPAWRGQGIAAALLDSGLRDYAHSGFTACSVDFESFNPEAAAFWLRYFQPACFSLTRAPESEVAR